MYGDNQSSQTNSMLLTSLLTEALTVNSSNSTTSTAQTPQFDNLFQTNDLQQQPLLSSPASSLASSTTPTSSTISISSGLPSLFCNNSTALTTSTPSLDTTNPFLLNSAALNHIFLLNSTLLQQEILRLSQDTNTFHLNDDGSELSRSTTTAPPSTVANIAVEKPLDLTTTVRKLSTNIEQSSISTLRPSVIKNSFPSKPPRLEQSTRNCGVKRSTSSLSYRSAPDPDVSDHFRRSLSGKWPRRPTNYSHYTINSNRFECHTPLSWQSSAASTCVTSPTTPRRQFLGSNSCVSQMVIGESEVEEHFRRTFELLRQNTTNESVSKKSSSSPPTSSTKL